MEDLQNYLSIRNERYKAKNGENEFVYVKLYNNEPKPLTNRAIEDIVYKYTKAFDKKMSPHKLRHTYATNHVHWHILLLVTTASPSDYQEEVPTEIAT